MEDDGSQGRFPVPAPEGGGGQSHPAPEQADGIDHIIKLGENGIPYYILINKKGLIVDYGSHLRPSMKRTLEIIKELLDE